MYGEADESGVARNTACRAHSKMAGASSLHHRPGGSVSECARQAVFRATPLFHVRNAHPDRDEPRSTRSTRRSRRNRFCVFLCFLWPHCIELRRMPRPMTVWTGGNRAKARFVSAPFRHHYRDSIRFSAASAASCTARLRSVRPARIRGRSSGAPI